MVKNIGTGSSLVGAIVCVEAKDMADELWFKVISVRVFRSGKIRVNGWDPTGLLYGDLEAEGEDRPACAVLGIYHGFFSWERPGWTSLASQAEAERRADSTDG